jgi:hypothetical protein
MMRPRGAVKRKLSDMSENDCIFFEDSNPHKQGSASYNRYEAFKKSQSLGQFYSLNRDAQLRYKDWQYAVDRKCISRLGSVTLKILIYDHEKLAEEISWVCDNRMSDAALLSMLAEDFGCKQGIEVLAASKPMDPDERNDMWTPYMRVSPCGHSLVKLGLGAQILEAYIYVRYPTWRAK